MLALAILPSWWACSSLAGVALAGGVSWRACSAWAGVALPGGVCVFLGQHPFWCLYPLVKLLAGQDGEVGTSYVQGFGVSMWTWRGI